MRASVRLAVKSDAKARRVFARAAAYKIAFDVLAALKIYMYKCSAQGALHSLTSTRLSTRIVQARAFIYTNLMRSHVWRHARAALRLLLQMRNSACNAFNYAHLICICNISHKQCGHLFAVTCLQSCQMVLAFSWRVNWPRSRNKV